MNKNKELLPYYMEAKERVSYDPNTGILTWVKSMSNRVRNGSQVGNINAGGYRILSISINGIPRYLKASRLAWYIVHNELPIIIDHIDGNTDNNKLVNLRNCNHQQNQRNRGKTRLNKTGYKGVYLSSSGNKYKASLKVDGRNIYLGSFDNPIDASNAYKLKAKEVFGDFYRDF